MSRGIPTALLFLLSLGTAGISAPVKSTLPVPAPPGMVSVQKNAARQFVITWKPVPGAYAYEIQRASGPIGSDKTGPWEEIVNPVLTDKDIPWTDKDSSRFEPDPYSMGALMGIMQLAQGVWYRIRVFNFDGVPSAWSAAYEAKKPDPKASSLFFFRR